MVGGKASRKAATAVSDAETQALIEAWSKRDKVSAEMLVRSQVHVFGAIGAKVMKAFPEMGETWDAMRQALCVPCKLKEAADFFEAWPEPLRYVIFTTLSALLMEGDNIVAAFAAMPAEKRTILASELAQTLFSGPPFWDERAGQAFMDKGAVPPPDWSATAEPADVVLLPVFQAPGVASGMVEYTVKTGPSTGQKRPAVVSRMNFEERIADLVAFFSPVDQPHENALQLQGVPFSGGGETGTWFHPAYEVAGFTDVDGKPAAQVDGELGTLA